MTPILMVPAAQAGTLMNMTRHTVTKKLHPKVTLFIVLSPFHVVVYSRNALKDIRWERSIDNGCFPPCKALPVVDRLEVSEKLPMISNDFYIKKSTRFFIFFAAPIPLHNGLHKAASGGRPRSAMTMSQPQAARRPAIA
jgi:hypothetical protein